MKENEKVLQEVLDEITKAIEKLCKKYGLTYVKQATNAYFTTHRKQEKLMNEIAEKEKQLKELRKQAGAEI